VFPLSDMQEVLLRHLKAHIGDAGYVIHPLVLIPPHPLDKKPGPYWAITIPSAGISVFLGAGHTVVHMENGEGGRWFIGPFGKAEYLGPKKRARMPGWLKAALKEYGA